MICPLLSDAETDDACDKEYCAIYDKDWKRCAILSIAKALQKLDRPHAPQPEGK